MLWNVARCLNSKCCVYPSYVLFCLCEIDEKGQGPRSIIFGPMKCQNMTRRKNATSYYIRNLWLTTIPNVHWKKNIIAPFHEFSMPQCVAKKNTKNNRHFSPIFGDKLVNWNLKSLTYLCVVFGTSYFNLRFYHRKWG